jgi:hypothetical protein
MSNGFSGLVDVGRNVLFIELAKDGIFLDNDKLLDKCLLENYIVFIDMENFHQKEDLIKMIKTINKRNNKIMVWIYCTPQAKLTSKVDNTFFNIIFNKDTKLDKIKDVIIEHFISYNSNFIFYVNTQEEIDKVTDIVTKFLIPKKLIYLSSDDNNIELLKNNAILNKYNFCPDFKKMLWED